MIRQTVARPVAGTSCSLAAKSSGAAAVPFAALLVLSLLAMSQRGSAQDPWSTTMTTSLNPLPIGNCTSVQIGLTDSSGKDTPRNPNGMRVSMADFDLSVTSPTPRAVIGRYNGSNSYSMCACQAATVGSRATVTATYPARMLAAKYRVPGVAFSVSAPFLVGVSTSKSEPGGCGQTATTSAPPPPSTTCSTGQSASGGACINLPVGAPCASGGVADGAGRCLAPSTCSAGQAASGSACVNLPVGAACPTGGVANGAGGCSAQQSITCTSGQTLSGNMCVNRPVGAPCQTGAADGYGKCVAPQPVICSNGQVLSGGGCVNLPVGAPCQTGVADGAGSCLAPRPASSSAFYGRFSTYRTPPFITQRTRSSSVTSTIGSPATAVRHAGIHPAGELHPAFEVTRPVRVLR